MDSYTYTDEDIQIWMEAAEKIIREAGELIKTNLGKSANLADKDSNEGHASNVLTETDVAVEKLFRDGMKALFEDHEFIGEENEGTEDKITRFSNNPTWIIGMNYLYAKNLLAFRENALSRNFN